MLLLLKKRPDGVEADPASGATAHTLTGFIGQSKGSVHSKKLRQKKARWFCVKLTQYLLSIDSDWVFPFQPRVMPQR